MPTMPKKCILSFSPLGPMKYGTSIRSNYLVEGFRSRGQLLGSYDNVPISRHSFGDMAKLASSVKYPLVKGQVKKSSILFFEGLPYAPNRQRTEQVFGIVEDAKAQGKKIVLDLYDDPLLQSRDISGTESHKKEWTEARQRFFGFADLITFPSETMRDLYVSQGLDLSKCGILPNASDPNRIKCSGAGEPDSMVILTGWGPGRGNELLLDSFGMIRDGHPSAKLFMAVPGNEPGPEMGDRIRLLTGNGLELHNDITYEGASDFLARGMVGVIPHSDLPYMHLATPIKLFDFMASGRPVVSTDCLETARIISQEECGLISEFEPEAFAEKAAWLFENPGAARKMGMNGRSAIENKHSWRHRSEALESMMARLILE